MGKGEGSSLHQEQPHKNKKFWMWGGWKHPCVHAHCVWLNTNVNLNEWIQFVLNRKQILSYLDSV